MAIRQCPQQRSAKSRAMICDAGPIEVELIIVSENYTAGRSLFTVSGFYAADNNYCQSFQYCNT